MALSFSDLVSFCASRRRAATLCREPAFLREYWTIRLPLGREPLSDSSAEKLTGLAHLLSASLSRNVYPEFERRSTAMKRYKGYFEYAPYLRALDWTSLLARLADERGWLKDTGPTASYWAPTMEALYERLETESREKIESWLERKIGRPLTEEEIDILFRGAGDPAFYIARLQGIELLEEHGPVAIQVPEGRIEAMSALQGIFARLIELVSLDRRFPFLFEYVALRELWKEDPEEWSSYLCARIPEADLRKHAQDKLDAMGKEELCAFFRNLV